MFLFKVVLFFIVIYYALKAIGRLFLPFMVDQAAQKLKNQKQYKQKRQGDITIHFQDDKPDKNKNKFGEYVDYEEIKD